MVVSTHLPPIVGDAACHGAAFHVFGLGVELVDIVFGDVGVNMPPPTVALHGETVFDAVVAPINKKRFVVTFALVDRAQVWVAALDLRVVLVDLRGTDW